MQNSMSTNVLWRANYNEKKSDRYFSQHGQGRDGYILNTSTNGGDGMESIFKTSNSPRDKPSYFDKRIKYFSDGQGRDSYIFQHQPGHFEHESGVNTKQKFQSTFRQYESPRHSPKQSIIMVTAREAAAFKKQRMLSTQLSQPKLIDGDALNAQITAKMQNCDWNRTRILQRQQNLFANGAALSPLKKSTLSIVTTGFPQSASAAAAFGASPFSSGTGANASNGTAAAAASVGIASPKGASLLFSPTFKKSFFDQKNKFQVLVSPKGAQAIPTGMQQPTTVLATATTGSGGLTERIEATQNEGMKSPKLPSIQSVSHLRNRTHA